MTTKVEQRNYEEALAWLREHGFDLLEAPGTQGRVFLKKYNCSAAIQKTAEDGVKIFAYPGYLIGSEISKLVNRGYQQFLKTAKTEGIVARAWPWSERAAPARQHSVEPSCAWNNPQPARSRWSNTRSRGCHWQRYAPCAPACR